MTTWNARVDQIVVDARRLKPARVLPTLIVTPFFVLGWLLGAVWLACMFVWQAAYAGFHEPGRARRPSE